MGIYTKSKVRCVNNSGEIAQLGERSTEAHSVQTSKGLG